MSTTEQPTCGKGLAENSVLPAKLGDVITAMAENLEVHMKALIRPTKTHEENMTYMNRL